MQYLERLRKGCDMGGLKGWRGRATCGNLLGTEAKR